MKDLAPHIHRQRLVIEGFASDIITSDCLKKYLSALSDALGMITCGRPVTNRSDKFGWAGWIHWETSGAHGYAWEEPRPFFSVDIYTCKPFDNKDAVKFTKSFFKATEIVYKSF